MSCCRGCCGCCCCLILLRLFLVLSARAQGALYVEDGHSLDRGLGQLMVGQWRCMLEDVVSGRTLARVLSPAGASPPPCFPDVVVHAYAGWPPRRTLLDPRRTRARWWSGWEPRRGTVLLVHGFNGGVDKAPLTTLRDAYLRRGGVNVLVLDWSALSRYPCYSDAVRQTRTAARCGAQVALSLGALTKSLSLPPTPLTCVGHSLGAHVCAMLSRAMPRKLFKIVALDPALPQVSRLLGNDALSASAASTVQSFHTNMGFYGDFPSSARPGSATATRTSRASPLGHASFCFNGGRLQPHCDRGTRFARMRCSHFLSVCFYAQLVRDGRTGTWATTVPCDAACDRLPGLPPFAVKVTEAAIDRWRGTHCLQLDLDRPCRIDA